MASGDDIIDRVCAIAKINTNSATERALVLSMLNEAAAKTCTAVDIRIPANATVTLTEGQAVYTLNAAPFPTDMLGILEMTLTDGSVTGKPLDFITMPMMDSYREGSSANESPYCYAVDWPQFVLFPSPGAGASLSLRYSQAAPTISDNSTALTFLPEAFLWGCLYQYTLAKAFEYKKDPSAHAEAMGLYLNDDSGIRGLRRWKALGGGRQGPMHAIGGRKITNPSQDQGF